MRSQPFRCNCYSAKTRTHGISPRFPQVKRVNTNKHNKQTLKTRIGQNVACTAARIMASQSPPHDFRQQYLQGFNTALTLSGIDPRIEPNQISNITIECTSKNQNVPPALRRQQMNESNARHFDQRQNNSDEQMNQKFKEPNSLMLILRVESWYPIPPLWFFKTVFGSIEHHQRLLSTIYLKREAKIKPKSKNKNKPKVKTYHKEIFITKLRCTQNASLCNGLVRNLVSCKSDRT